jgi:TonB family protein
VLEAEQERWRSALEGYVSAVDQNRQRALNEARVPFAGFLNSFHNRLHPIFADGFLASLTALGDAHPLNDPALVTWLDVAVDGEGKIVRLGVVRRSSVVAFDIAALEAMEKAQPLGPPPDMIRSADGLVYFRWEFYRNPQHACSTYYAHPYLLETPPASP